MKRWMTIAAAFGPLLSGCESVCGNGKVESGEQCDLGDSAGPGCTPICQVAMGYECEGGTSCAPVCGDGFSVVGEVCDPSFAGETQYCSADCLTLIASCADGTVQPAHEACDDDNDEPGDGCDYDCQPSFGFHCDPEANTCDASAVDPSLPLGDMNEFERLSFCQWWLWAMGDDDAGTTFTCGATEFYVDTVAECVDIALNVAYPQCTVGEYEAWFATRGDRCEALTSDVPWC